MARSIYLDCNATTPVDRAVLEAMLPYFDRIFGNASSQQHSFGLEAARAVQAARGQVSKALGVQEDEILFTSGATESNNLAILGVARRNQDAAAQFVTASTEHSAVLAPFRALEREGRRVTYLPVDRHGRLDPEAVERTITPHTVLVSVMAANNEIGTLQPVAEIGRICRAHGVLFHTDAAQALGKVPLAIGESAVDLASVSAHKVYGPKGVGALFIRRRRPAIGLEPLVHGGGQERGLRPGTLPVPLIVGFGKACELAQSGLVSEAARIGRLRDRLAASIVGGVQEVRVNGHPDERLPGLLHLSFSGFDGESLMFALQDVAMSQGSSCSSGSMEPSHVLRAIGVEEPWLSGSVRLGVGRFTTDDDVEQAGARIVETVRRLRSSG